LSGRTPRRPHSDTEYEIDERFLRNLLAGVAQRLDDELAVNCCLEPLQDQTLPRALSSHENRKIMKLNFGMTNLREVMNNKTMGLHQLADPTSRAFDKHF